MILCKSENFCYLVVFWICFFIKVIKGWTPFPHRGGNMSPFLVDSNGPILGLRCPRGSIFFCCELWTHRHPLGVRPAPKSICTHQAHPLKLLPRKNGQNPTFWPVWKGPVKRPQVPSEVQIRFQSINLGQKNPFYGHICIPHAFGKFGGKSKKSVCGRR